jgi:ABC-type multidrug transport system ATPase subunit
MDEAEMLCDRIALLNHGRIELSGTVSALRKQFQPKEQYVLNISEFKEVHLDILHSIPEVEDVSIQPSQDGTIEVTLSVQRGSKAIPEIVRHLGTTSVNVWSCSKKELSLEEMFRLAFSKRRSESDSKTDDYGEELRGKV